MMTIRAFWRQGAMRGIEAAAARRAIAEARQRWLPILEACVERDEDGVDEYDCWACRRPIHRQRWWNGAASRSASGCDGSARVGRIRDRRPMNGVITLGEMRAKGMTTLEVACRRWERRGRLSIERLIAEHGDGVLDPCAIIAHDCPRMRNPSASIYDRRGVNFPELPRWFLK
jgi:hypothetical protein